MHERGWHLSGDPDRELLFVGPDGRTVAESELSPSVEPGVIARQPGDGTPSIDDQTIQPTWAGEILDLDLAVIAIRSRNGLSMMYDSGCDEQ